LKAEGWIDVSWIDRGARQLKKLNAETPQDTLERVLTDILKLLEVKN
jgi:hypothetical protein